MVYGWVLIWGCDGGSICVGEDDNLGFCLWSVGEDGCCQFLFEEDHKKMVVVYLCWRRCSRSGCRDQQKMVLSIYV